MKYNNITEGIFLDRPNRFIAYAEIDGKVEMVHVKNTGRCKELLKKGVKVYLQRSDNPKRKTKYDLISVYKADKLINIDSQAPNKIGFELINRIFDVKYIKSECKYKKSRFDFYFETENEKAYLEVKGVTLEENGVVMFPDAPTERGVKHIKELIELKKEGYGAYILFVIQMNGIKYFTPNKKTHKEFAQILKIAENEGVRILAYDCIVSKDELICGNIVEYKSALID